ncbi:MAG: type III-A CRISPR-associated RAMP protein Csm5 [Candidatus Ratteibacteria bacterium]|jgi:CRISPR-associated protein Csm5
MKQYTVTLKVLSPLHIGCGEEYTPVEFIIDDRENVMKRFQPLDFCATLSPAKKKEFTDLCMYAKNPIEIYKFVKTHYNNSLSVQEIAISKEIARKYQEMLSRASSSGDINRFSIARTLFHSHSMLPYIPGSALKGAIRTAYLSWLSDKYPNINSKELEKELLARSVEKKSLEKDPFQYLKISDLSPSFGTQNTQKIVYAVNRKKKSSKKGRGPAQMLETIQQGSIFTGTLSIQEENTFTWKNIKEAIKIHYSSIWEDDNEVLKKTGISEISDRQGTGITLRMGRHSGAEAVTMRQYRKIKIRTRTNYQILKNATTIWLASEESKPLSLEKTLPFGWISMSVAPLQ